MAQFVARARACNVQRLRGRGARAGRARRVARARKRVEASRHCCREASNVPTWAFLLLVADCDQVRWLHPRVRRRSVGRRGCPPASACGRRALPSSCSPSAAREREG
jgi:hypothetical protein